MKRIVIISAMISGLMLVCPASQSVSAADSATGEETGAMERVEATAKRVGKKIEEGVKNTVKKVEEKHIGDKVEKKMKKAVDKTVEGFEKAGKKIEQKLGD